MAECGKTGGENKYQEQAARVRDIPMLTVGSATEPQAKQITFSKDLAQMNSGSRTMALVTLGSGNDIFSEYGVF